MKYLLRRFTMHTRWLTLSTIVVFACTAYLPTPATAQTPSDQELVTYLKAHWQTPEDYIVGKFANYDLVFVTELHRIKHDPQLIQALIPRLYKAGVRNLGFEFALYNDQADIDRLITAPTYDENLARRLLFNMFVGWGYKEYEDVLRVAWDFNRSLPAGAPRFRIVGLTSKADWSKARDDMTEAELNATVWGGRSPDAQMADAVIKEFVDKHQKALIYSGRHHGFTRFRQPAYDYQAGRFTGFRGLRMGNIVYARAPQRVFNIMLHAPFLSKQSEGSYVLPVNGTIDRIMSSFADPRVGFDVAGTPFGRLHDDNTVFAAGYDDFTLSTITDGYVFQKPLEQYEGVSVDDKFITADNIEEAVRNIPNVRARTARRTPEDMMANMRRDADWQRVWTRIVNK